MGVGVGLAAGNGALRAPREPERQGTDFRRCLWFLDYIPAARPPVQKSESRRYAAFPVIRVTARQYRKVHDLHAFFPVFGVFRVFPLLALLVGCVYPAASRPRPLTVKPF